MRTAWILGWAVPEPWFAPLVHRHFPAGEHVFLAPDADALARLAAGGPFDRIVGYSLGALLLLGAAEQVNATLTASLAAEAGRGHGPRLQPGSPKDPRAGSPDVGSDRSTATECPSPRVTLLAPIFAFAAEEQLGGRVARTQVRALARWLRRDPAAALADFYERAGLDVPPALAAAAATAPLAWGLTRLEQDRIAPPLPAGWAAFCGAADALLDATRLHALDPRIRLVPGATHHPAALLAAFAAGAPVAA